MKSIYQDYPACPGCETDVLVDGYTGLYDYICRGCSETFDGGGDR